MTKDETLSFFVLLHWAEVSIHANMGNIMAVIAPTTPIPNTSIPILPVLLASYTPHKGK